MTVEDPDIQQAQQILAGITQERRAMREAILDATLSSLSAPPCEPIQGERVTVCNRDGQVEARIVSAQGQVLSVMRGREALIFLHSFLGCDIWTADTALSIAARARKPCEIHYQLPNQAESKL